MKTSSYHSVNAKMGILPVIVILLLLILLAGCTQPADAGSPADSFFESLWSHLQDYCSNNPWGFAFLVILMFASLMVAFILLIKPFIDRFRAGDARAIDYLQDDAPERKEEDKEEEEPKIVTIKVGEVGEFEDCYIRYCGTTENCGRFILALREDDVQPAVFYDSSRDRVSMADSYDDIHEFKVHHFNCDYISLEQIIDQITD